MTSHNVCFNFRLYALVVFCGWAGLNKAVGSVLVPGATVALNGTGAPVGTVVTQSTQALNYGGGTLTTTVIKDSVTGGFDFLYVIAPNLELHDVSVNNFAGIAVDADYVVTNPEAPANATRSSDGSTVSYLNFAIGASAATVAPIFIKTNAIEFVDNGTITVTFPGEGIPGSAGGGDIITMNSTFAPSSIGGGPVPEPSTVLCLGLSSVLWFAWRRIN